MSVQKFARAVDITPDTDELTTAYASGWVSQAIEIPGVSQLTLRLTKAGAAPTSVELYGEIGDYDADEAVDADWFAVKAVADGVSDGNDEVSVLNADIPGAIGYSIPEAYKVRFRAKRTGGDGTTALGLSIQGGGL